MCTMSHETVKNLTKLLVLFQNFRKFLCPEQKTVVKVMYEINSFSLDIFFFCE